MPNSMTGFGRGEGRIQDNYVSCEIRSVNHRYLSVKWRVPHVFSRFQQRVEEQLRKHLKRGSVEVHLQYRAAPKEAVSKLDETVAEHYRKTLHKYLQGHKVKQELSPEFLLQLPGVMVPPDPTDLASTLKPCVERAVKQALEELCEARQREGLRLEKALRRELKTVSTAVGKVKRRAPKIVQEYRDRLTERVEALLKTTKASLDEDSLTREVVVFAERSDITEEIDRLASHTTEIESLLQQTTPIGRSLDFLVQELSREIHTMGAKTQDKKAMADILRAKASVEKLREQVQNLE